MSFEFLISKIQKNNFLLIGRAGIDIYPDPPGTKTEQATKAMERKEAINLAISIIQPDSTADTIMESN